MQGKKDVIDILNEALKRGGLKWGDANVVYLGFPQHPPADDVRDFDGQQWRGADTFTRLDALRQ